MTHIIPMNHPAVAMLWTTGSEKSSHQASSHVSFGEETFAAISVNDNGSRVCFYNVCNRVHRFYELHGSMNYAELVPLSRVIICNV